MLLGQKVNVSVVNLFVVVAIVCIPLSNLESHSHNSWSETVRFRHLYAARAGVHLLIREDGQILGSADQTLYSLLEIRPVDPGCIVIKGIETAQFLCMEVDGRLYSSPIYSRDDCTFREQILPDGYSVYISVRHGVLLSLGNHRRRLQGRDRGVPALAQFLPRISTADQASTPALQSFHHPSQEASDATDQSLDAVESFGVLARTVHSPSFHKR
ncbi:fibroblast growth factor 19 isoform X2 [Phyllopteryx taeniolatus]|uniref:fibroblast growth factor 19 isoform X2 n=1 Tax=Phyllopteryx taeniolatus TaxID=161469 RepID=UPI002AD4A803|nr:fibroblast growth factor 19 isoform X2 [Phyllopteryx taeniolatus]